MQRSLMILGVILGLTCFASTASAEFRFEGVGLKGGISFSGAAYADDDLNTLADTKLGFSAGAQFVLGFHPIFALQPELLFVNKGNSFKVSALGISTDNTISTNYLEVPILAVLRLPLIEGITPYVMGGPYAGYFLFGSQTTATSNRSETNNFDADDINRLDFGAAFGAGVNLQLANFVLTVDLRHAMGFNNVSARFSDDENFKHRNTTLMLGVLF